MDYVMVPVPEELSDAVQRFLTWGVGRQEAAPWDEASLRAALVAMDDASRELVLLVAQTTVDEAPLSIVELGRRLGRSSREILGTILEVNHGAPPDHGRAYLLQLRPFGEGGAIDDLHGQLVFMEPPMASSLLAVGRSLG